MRDVWLFKVEDPTAVMLASWTKPKSTKRNKSFDEEEAGTLEDYYGVESAEVQLQQQETRLQQQQQPSGAFGDVDYRKFNGENAAGGSSGGNGGGGGGGYYSSYSPSESPSDTGRPASNEFGDVDER